MRGAAKSDIRPELNVHYDTKFVVSASSALARGYLKTKFSSGVTDINRTMHTFLSDAFTFFWVGSAGFRFLASFLASFLGAALTSPPKP